MATLFPQRLMNARRLFRTILLIPAVVSASACASTGRLAEYDFRDRTLALFVDSPPVPEIFDASPPPIVGMDDEGQSEDRVSALARLGSGILREVITSDARQRLVEASEQVNVAELLGERALERAARTLRARAVEDGPADFEIEVRITRYGITSQDVNAQAFFVVEGELLLIDGADGSRIWKTGLDQREPINRGDVELNDSEANVVTAAVFATLSTEQMAAALRGVAQHAADHAADRLQAGLEKARGN